MLNFLLGFVEIDWSQSQDLTCILISEDKASAKKIKGKSVDLSSGAGRHVCPAPPLSVISPGLYCCGSVIVNWCFFYLIATKPIC